MLDELANDPADTAHGSEQCHTFHALPTLYHVRIGVHSLICTTIGVIIKNVYKYFLLLLLLPVIEGTYAGIFLGTFRLLQPLWPFVCAVPFNGAIFAE